MRRRVAVLVTFVVCVAVIGGYQATRPARGDSSPRVFVPSAQFFADFSPSFRTTIADAYWLRTVQYYGEHISGDKKFDSLWPMLDLTTRLSPRFTRPYRFGAFALLDAGRGDLAYDLLLRGHEANPQDWQLPALLGFFVYSYASNPDKNALAAKWYLEAGKLPGSKDYVRRMAARMLVKSGERETAIMMWAQIYGVADQYSRDKAIEALDELLPAEPVAREREVETLREFMSADQFRDLSQTLLEAK